MTVPGLAPPPLYLEWPAAATRPAVSLPGGYSIRSFVPGDYPGDPIGDEAAWVQLVNPAFPHFDNAAALRDMLPHVLPGGIFFAMDDASGEPVATASAVDRSLGGHLTFPGGACLGYLVTAPEHRRRGLAHALCARVVNQLVGAGYRTIWAGATDDSLEAIGLYLRLGFLPLRYTCAFHDHPVGGDVVARWHGVFARLNLPFTPERWPIR
jgi:mycothiol synthase